MMAIAGTSAWAQRPGFSVAQVQVENAPSFKYYVWGQVGGPGMKLLGAEADIVELLSAAGGPTSDADLSRVELIRGVDRQVETLNLRLKLEKGDIVTLSPGDIVIVKRNFWPRFREGLTIISGFAILVNLAFTLARYSD
jgi:protein involved in polysaccharide export with SLBB domain